MVNIAIPCHAKSTANFEIEQLIMLPLQSNFLIQNVIVRVHVLEISAIKCELQQLSTQWLRLGATARRAAKLQPLTAFHGKH